MKIWFGEWICSDQCIRSDEGLISKRQLSKSFTVVIRTLSTRLYLRDAMMTFKCMAGRAPRHLSSQVIKRKEVSSRKTRSCQMLHIAQDELQDISPLKLSSAKRLAVARPEAAKCCKFPFLKLAAVKRLFISDLWIFGIILTTHLRFE